MFIVLKTGVVGSRIVANTEELLNNTEVPFENDLYIYDQPVNPTTSFVFFARHMVVLTGFHCTMSILYHFTNTLKLK